jgi:hypothetical protein
MTDNELRRRVDEERLRKLLWQRRRRERKHFDERVAESLQRLGYKVDAKDLRRHRRR